MDFEQRLGVRKLDELRQRRIEVIDVLTQNAACLAQPDDIRVRELRRKLGSDSKRVGNPLELPDVLDHLSRRVLRIDFLGIQRDLGEVPLRPIANLAVDAGKFAVEGINGFLKMADGSRGTAAVETLNLGGNLMDGVLELLHAVLFAGQQRNGKRTDFIRQLLLQHRQGRVLHRGHKHPLALGQIVADDVGDGVRLAGARRTLHNDAIGNIQQLDDADLLVVEGLWEVEVARLLVARAALGD